MMKSKIRKQRPKQTVPDAPYNGKPNNAEPRPPESDARPSAMEIAKLAAILSPNANGLSLTTAMTRAMEYIVEAEQFRRELPTGFDDLVKRFGIETRQEPDWEQTFRHGFDLWWNDAYTEKDALDAVAAAELPETDIKTMRGVCGIIERYWSSHAPEDEMVRRTFNADAIIANIRRWKTVPKLLLECALDWEKKQLRKAANARVRRSRDRVK